MVVHVYKVGAYCKVKKATFVPYNFLDENMATTATASV